MKLLQNANLLNQQFDLKQATHFEQDEHGLVRLQMAHQDSKATLYLLGAHLTCWQPTGQKPVLWMSEKSDFKENLPIRGGIPICFPWFAKHQNDPQLPNHGFARTQTWQIQLVTRNPNDELVVALILSDNQTTTAMWPHRFELRYTITLGKTLATTLSCKNTGDQPFTFTEALHHYFAVGDVRQVQITGTENQTYYSKSLGKTMTQSAKSATIIGETDRVYCHATNPCVLEDPSFARRILIEKEGSKTTVIWNPWIEKSKIMPDFGDQEWPTMLCIEAANALENTVTLKPNQTHELYVNVATLPFNKA